MGILSDLTGVKYGQLIDVECDNVGKNPRCKGRWQIQYQLSKLRKRESILCQSCRNAINRESLVEKSRASWKNDDVRRNRMTKLAETNAKEETKRKRSQGMLRQWKNNEERRKKTSEFMTARNAPDDVRKAHSEKVKRYFNQPGIREEHGKKIANAVTPERRKRQSEHAKKMWKNPDCRERIVTAIHRNTKTTEFRQRVSDWMQAFNAAHPEHVEALRNRLHEFRSRPEYKEFIANVIHERHKDPKFKKRFSQTLKDLWNDERRLLHSEKLKKYNAEHPESVAKHRKAIKRALLRKGVKGYVSKGQECLFRLCEGLYDNVVLNDAHLIGGKIPDIVIYSQRVIIEYDGEFWHRTSKKKDIEAIGLYLAAGFRTIRFLVHKRQEDEKNFDAAFYKKEIQRFIKSKRKFDIIEVE